jgi:type I restriction enzyme M protein
LILETNLLIRIRLDESIGDSANLPVPEILAKEIADNLESALEQFNEIYQDLGNE